MNDLIKYSDGEIELSVSVEKDTIWLSQLQISELFETSTDNISLHLKNIYKEKELDENTTTEDSSVVRQEGKRKFTIVTKSISKQLKLDTEKYNKQYDNLEVKISNKYHDRFLIIDDTKTYHIGASLKDLAKKVFAFSLINSNLLRKLN